MPGGPGVRAAYALSNGLTIRYALWQGGEPPLILIHGLGGRLEVWSPVASLLSPRHAVAALDLRGFGLSSKPPSIPTLSDFAQDVKAVLDDLGWEEAVIVGSSMGGMVAVRFHSLHPQRVKALVLSNTAPSVTIDLELLERALEGDEEALAAMASRLSRALSAHPPRTPGSMFSSTPDYVVGVARSIMGEDLSMEMAWIRKPTLIIVGEEDRVTPPSEARRMSLLIEDSILVTIPRARHLTHIDSPKEYAAAIEEFLRKHSPAK